MKWDTLDNGEELEASTFRSLGTLLNRSGTANGATLAPFHLSVREWLRNDELAGEYCIFVRAAQKSLARFAWERFSKTDKSDPYAAKVLPKLLIVGAR